MVGASLIGVCTGPGIGKAGLRGAWPGKFVSAHQRFGAAALALFLVGVAAGQVLPFQSPRASFANGECGIIAAARMPLANCVRSSSGNDPGQETIAATGLVESKSASVLPLHLTLRRCGEGQPDNHLYTDAECGCGLAKDE